jgi:hypothetical protein
LVVTALHFLVGIHNRGIDFKNGPGAAEPTPAPAALVAFPLQQLAFSGNQAHGGKRAGNANPNNRRRQIAAPAGFADPRPSGTGHRSRRSCQARGIVVCGHRGVNRCEEGTVAGGASGGGDGRDAVQDVPLREFLLEFLGDPSLGEQDGAAGEGK